MLTPEVPPRNEESPEPDMNRTKTLISSIESLLSEDYDHLNSFLLKSVMKVSQLTSTMQLNAVLPIKKWSQMTLLLKEVARATLTKLVIRLSMYHQYHQLLSPL